MEIFAGLVVYSFDVPPIGMGDQLLDISLSLLTRGLLIEFFVILYKKKLFTNLPKEK